MKSNFIYCLVILIISQVVVMNEFCKEEALTVGIILFIHHALFFDGIRFQTLCLVKTAYKDE